MRYKLLIAVLAGIAVAGGALAQTGNERGDGGAPAAQAGLTRESFFGSVWRQDIENGNPPVYYLELRSDGKMGYNQNAPRSFTYDGTDSWRVEGGKLILVWTNGYTTDTFSLDVDRPDTLVGIQSRGTKKIVMRRQR